MPRLTARERRERYQREYAFQKKHGKSFFPHAVFHDTIVSLIVVGIIMGMAILWYAQFDAIPAAADAGRFGGILGPAYEAKADPGVLAYDPRPEWYFFFLFELFEEAFTVGPGERWPERQGNSEHQCDSGADEQDVHADLPDGLRTASSRLI